MVHGLFALIQQFLAVEICLWTPCELWLSLKEKKVSNVFTKISSSRSFFLYHGIMHWVGASACLSETLAWVHGEEEQGRKSDLI